MISAATTFDHDAPLDLELRRNRRRTLAILSLVVLVASCWAVRAEVRARQSAAARRPIAAAASFRPRPAAPHLERKLVYPYSVIPGGVHSAEALSRALANDPVAAAHYAGFNIFQTRPVAAPPGTRLYASYRVGDAVYWTSKPVPLKDGETLLSDGAHLARARCGNRLSAEAQEPVGPDDELASLQAEEPAEQWRDSGPAAFGSAGPYYPEFVRAPEIFPSPFADNDAKLSEEATSAAAEFTESVPAPPDADETLSGYSDFLHGATAGAYVTAPSRPGFAAAGGPVGSGKPRSTEPLSDAGFLTGFGTTPHTGALPWSGGWPGEPDSAANGGIPSTVYPTGFPSLPSFLENIAPSFLENIVALGGSGALAVEGLRGYSVAPDVSATVRGGAPRLPLSPALTSAEDDNEPRRPGAIPASVPEPGPFLLAVLGLTVLALLRAGRREPDAPLPGGRPLPGTSDSPPVTPHATSPSARATRSTRRPR